jgi:ABC-type phosphate transport system substrate-binding protein
MTHKKITQILLMSVLSAVAQADELVIIGNNKNQLKQLEARQVQDIYMGRKRDFPDGKMALPIDQVMLRTTFYETLTTKPIEQINAYWARIMFSGQASPPMILPDDQAVIKAVSENEGAIGYVNKASLNKQVHVLLNLK